MIKFKTKSEAIRHINKLRLASGDRWVFLDFSVNDYDMRIKYHKTWVQALWVNGFKLSNEMGASVTSFKQWLNLNIQGAE